MNILLVSHGGLSAGVADAYRMFSPGAEYIHALGLTEEGGVAAFREELNAKLDDLLEAGDVLVIADLKGGTPYNESYARFLASSDHMRLAAGLNLPMLVECGMLASMGSDLDTVYQTALRAGAEGVQGTDIPDGDDSDEDDDLF